MGKHLMQRCEVRRAYQATNGGIVHRWKEEAVADVGTPDRIDIRCMHCHGGVRIHRQKVPHGPEDHVEHLSRQDSAGCLGGHYFEGVHQMSTAPVP